jgi:integrase
MVRVQNYYHLFKTWYTNKKGDRYFYWWYWWYDPDTLRQLKKPAGRAETTKKRAQEYINNLPIPSGKADTVRAVAEGMFEAGSPYLLRREAKGAGMKDGTLRAYSGFVRNHIVKDWGNTPLNQIEGADIEDWLMEKPFSNSTRNSIIDCWNLIFREAKRAKKIRSIPTIERFARNSRRYDTFRDDELFALFPEKRDDLITLYSDPENDYDEEIEYYGLMFAVMLLTTVSGGLRSGEIRALCRDQVFINQSGIVVSKALDSNNKVTLPKKGKDDNPKWRAVLLPERAIQALSWWLEVAPPSGMLFKYAEKPVDRNLLLDRLKLGMERVGIKPEGRKLKVHSLRYTYNTRMETLLSEERLLQFMGHESRQMTLHYSRPYWQERLVAYEGDKAKVEQFWK